MQTIVELNDEVLSRVSNTVQIQITGNCFSIRVLRNMCFVVLRKFNKTVQCVLMKKDNPLVFNTLAGLTEESSITIGGTVKKSPTPIKSCTVTAYEIEISDLDIISHAKTLPFFVANADNILVDADEETKEDTEEDTDNSRARVSRQSRLENRWIDLRASNNYTIVVLRSNLLNAIRSIVLADGFIEVSTPKIVPTASESGSSVFSLDYFKKKAALAQSPQLYKQMLINSGFRGIFEVGPVFRAENSGTYRHLCEFTGLDLEFPIEPYQSHLNIISRIWSILYRAFEQFYDANKPAIEQIFSLTGVTKLVMPDLPVLIDFVDGAVMLRDAGFDQDPTEDIGSVNERELGKIIKQKYGIDIFALINYPTKVRPFYTMAKQTGPIGEIGEPTYAQYSRSFDLIMRNNEVSSGAQRVHNPSMLKDRIRLSGIELDFEHKTSGLEDYVRSFEYGSVPHGGCGIGVERLIMLYLGLPNVRSVSLFPRDPKTLMP